MALREDDASTIGGGSRSWLRLVLVFVLASLVVLPVAAGLAWLRFAGGRGAWLPVGAVFGSLGLGCGWLAIDRRWRRVRVAGAVALAIVFGAVGVAVAHIAPPSEARLRSAIRDLEQPGWHLNSDYGGGNAICFDQCTEVERLYIVDVGAGALISDLESALETHFGTHDGPQRGQTVELATDRGDVRFRITIRALTSTTSEIDLSATAR